jgi:hypothetical protein
MNTLSIKRLKTPSDYETDVFVIDGRPLYEYLNEWVNGDEQLLYKPDVLAICWTDDYDFEGDSRFMRFVLAQDKAITPILSCPEDFDFSCTVVVADVEKRDDVVIWKRIGSVNHSKEVFEEEKKHGILYLNSYTEEDWEKYGDNIALEEVDSEAWRDWIGKNWSEELYRRRINYTYPKYQYEENIDWIAECNFVFNRADYDRLVESCYVPVR